MTRCNNPKSQNEISNWRNVSILLAVCVISLLIVLLTNIVLGGYTVITITTCLFSFIAVMSAMASCMMTITLMPNRCCYRNAKTKGEIVPLVVTDSEEV